MNMNFADVLNWISSLYQTQNADGSWNPPPRMWIEPQVYTVTFSALAVAATATQILQLRANEDFVLTAMSHHANVAAAGQTVSTKIVPLARINITDVGSGNNYFGQPTDLENVSGNEYPREFPMPRWHSGNTSLSLVLTNYDAAQAYNVDVSLIGMRVRRYSQPVLTQSAIVA